MVTSRITELVGRVLEDRYRLIRPIGAGASAHVYAADDVRLRRRVAIKVLHPALAADEAFGRRFEAEAQVVAGLRHPNIMRVYDWGVDDGAPYLVMDLLEGGSLRSLLDRGHLLTPAQAASVGADVASALEYAHRRGLVHRDIKPANLIFDDEGRVTVADFGLARALAEASWTEPMGTMVGTARYAAPEQARGQQVDARADVYALALVLVEAMTGTVPFGADTVVGTLMARVDSPLVAPSSVGHIGRVLEAAGTVRPEDRLDATGLARGLHQAAEGLPPPGLLPLAGPVVTGDVERDSHPTEVPGAPRLFDAEATEAAEAAATFPAEAARAARPWEADAERTLGMDATGPPGAGGAPTGLLGEHPDARADEGDGGHGGLPGRRRRVPRWAWIVGVVALLVAAGVAAYVLTRPPPSHPVPSLRGDTEAQAAAALAPLHLHLDVTGRVYDPNAPAGTVLSQNPAPTSGLHEGGRVHAVVSKGPQPVNVPKLAGQTPDEAKAVLTTLGLRLGTVTPAASETVPEGQIISTTPAVGTALPGQAVDVVVSSGKPFVTVPLLAGAQVASYAAAQAALAGLGLAPVESDQFSDTVPKGQVIATSPAPGVSVRQDTPVTVKISKGPDLVAVPSVAQQSVAAASQAMAAAGLSVSGVTGDPTKTVTASNPPAGTMLHRGSAVQLVT